MIMFLSLVSRPDLPESSLSALSVGVVLMVLTGTKAFVVSTWDTVLPPLSVTTVVITSRVSLETNVSVVSRSVVDGFEEVSDSVEVIVESASGVDDSSVERDSEGADPSDCPDCSDCSGSSGSSDSSGPSVCSASSDSLDSPDVCVGVVSDVDSGGDEVESEELEGGDVDVVVGVSDVVSGAVSEVGSVVGVVDSVGVVVSSSSELDALAGVGVVEGFGREGEPPVPGGAFWRRSRAP